MLYDDILYEHTYLKWGRVSNFKLLCLYAVNSVFFSRGRGRGEFLLNLSIFWAGDGGGGVRGVGKEEKLVPIFC